MSIVPSLSDFRPARTDPPSDVSGAEEPPRYGCYVVNAWLRNSDGTNG
jgi:hypothetical protein